VEDDNTFGDTAMVKGIALKCDDIELKSGGEAAMASSATAGEVKTEEEAVQQPNRQWQKFRQQRWRQ
jgi:hypothetical protein